MVLGILTNFVCVFVCFDRPSHILLRSLYGNFRHCWCLAKLFIDLQMSRLRLCRWGW